MQTPSVRLGAGARHCGGVPCLGPQWRRDAARGLRSTPRNRKASPAPLPQGPLAALTLLSWEAELAPPWLWQVCVGRASGMAMGTTRRTGTWQGAEV